LLRVVLTGGIASGKSLVAERFAARGVPVVDTDVIAREVVEPGSEGLAAVVAAFGDDVLTADGHLDRAGLRRRIFADDTERERLEAVLHPRIRAEMHRQLDAHERAGAPWALAVIPLLVETHQAGDFDRVIVVDTPEAAQVARVMARDGGSEADARAILERQASRAERLRLADHVIANEDVADPVGTIDPQVAALDAAFRRLAVDGA